MSDRETQYEKYLRNGQDIFEKYCSTKDKCTMMLPRAPQQTYIDLYPETDEPGCSFENDRQQQLNYEAEVKVYRALEKLKEALIVLHGFEYTHFQYHLGDSSHDRRKCQKCKKPATRNDREGECDFIVIASNYFVIIEVKNMLHIGKTSEPEKDKKMKALTGTFRKSSLQREKIANLIKRFCKRLTVLTFTVYPNFEQSYKSEFQLKSAERSTIIFKEDIADFGSWWEDNVNDFVAAGHLQPEFRKKQEEVRNLLLAMWCTEKKTYDMAKCSLGQCVLEIDEKLRSGKFTFRSNNPEVVPTPQLVKDYLGIENLTKEQCDAINSTEQFLWINGPAGAGKTIVLMARMLKFVLSSTENKVVLFNTTHPKQGLDATQFHQGTLEKAGVTNVQMVIEEISEDPTELYNEIQDRLKEYQVVILALKCFRYAPTHEFVPKRLKKLIKMLKDVNIYFDDVQIMYARDGGLGDDTGLLNMLLRRARSHRICLACDMAQCLYFGEFGQNKRFGEELVDFFADNSPVRPSQMVSLTKILRNTFNLSQNLSEIRSRIVEICDVGPSFVNKMFPCQALGHYIHGPKTVLHVLENYDKKIINKIITSQIDHYLDDGVIDVATDLGVIYCHGGDTLTSIVDDLVNHGRSNSVELKPMLLMSTSSMEWPTILVLQPLFDHHNERALKVDDGIWGIVDIMIEDLSVDLEYLYFAMSRARVQCTMVMYPVEGSTLDDFHRIKELLEKLDDSADIRRYPLTVQPQQYKYTTHNEVCESFRPNATSLVRKALEAASSSSIGGGTAGDTREFPRLVQGSRGKVSFFPGSNFRPK